MACTVEYRRVVARDVLRIREQKVGVELERELRRVFVRPHASFGLSLACRCLEPIEPLRGDGENAIANRPGMGVELRGNRGEEATTWEHAAFEVTQERFAQRAEPRDPCGGFQRGSDDLTAEDLIGGLDGRKLQLFLGSEVGEETALAEAHGGRETSDGQAFYALDGHEACCLLEDPFSPSCFAWCLYYVAHP